MQHFSLWFLVAFFFLFRSFLSRTLGLFAQKLQCYNCFHGNKVLIDVPNYIYNIFLLSMIGDEFCVDVVTIARANLLIPLPHGQKLGLALFCKEIKINKI